MDHDRALEVAAARGLTVYDAGYLWLAEELGAELVTLDGGLARAGAVRPVAWGRSAVPLASGGNGLRWWFMPNEG